MNSLPPDNEDLSEVDALYRRLSAAQASRPGEQVRRAVFSHATRLAAPTEPGGNYSWQGEPRRAWRRPAAFGALAAALLAVFMWMPRPSAPPVTSAVQVPAARAPAVAGAAPDSATVFADIGAAGQAPVLSAPAPAAPPQGRLAARDTLQPSVPVPMAGMTARNEAAHTGTAKSADAAPLGGAHANAAAAAAAPPVATARSAAVTEAGAALWQAAQDGDLAALRDLQQRHANLDAQDAAGRTALMIATLHGRSQAVVVLLDAGANPNIADGNGESPLDAALAADESEIITALKHHGAR